MDMDEFVCRRPAPGEWVNTHKAVPNGDGVRRGVDGPFLAQVIEVRDGDFQNGGCLVRIWDRPSQGFTETIFAPWCCVVSRTQVNHYALTGEWKDGDDSQQMPVL